MRNNNSIINFSLSNLNTLFFICTSIGLLACIVSPIGHAANWEFAPSITVKQTYSDNIDLESGRISRATGIREDETGCFVTEVNPGLTIKPRGEPGRVKFDLNVRYQNLIDAGCNRGGGSSFIQQEANLLVEVLKQSVFLEAKTSMSQQNQSNTRKISGDNLSDSGNRSRVRTYNISPYWTPHFGGYADGEVRFRYDDVHTSGGGASDAQTFEETVHLENGTRFSVLSWSVDFNNQKQQRDSNGDSVRFRDYSGELGARLGREFSIFAQGGNYENDFTSVTNSNQNGSFYTVGGGWTPGALFSIRGGGGNNSFVTVNINPSKRTSLEATYRKNEVGTNTGDTYELSLNHKTRRTVWNAKYFEDTTTVQTVLANQQIFAVVDAFGNPVVNPVSGQPNTIAIETPTLRDEVFVRKRGEVSFNGRTALSTISLTIFSEEREFQGISNDKDDVLGGTASWNWKFGKRTSSSLRGRWQRTHVNNAGVGGRSDNEFSEIALSIDRTLSRYFSAILEYRFQKQKSDNPLDEYDENRVTASLIYRY